MSETRKEAAVVESPRRLTTDPNRWTDKHTSTWDHVMGAIERDWEQTKSDFSWEIGGELKQTVADTVMHSLGSEAIPPLSAKTRPTVLTKETAEALKSLGSETGLPPDKGTQAIESDDTRKILTDRQAKVTESLMPLHDGRAGTQADPEVGTNPMVIVGDDGEDSFAQRRMAKMGVRVTS